MRDVVQDPTAGPALPAARARSGAVGLPRKGGAIGDLLHLQRHAGNHAVGHALRPTVQRSPNEPRKPEETRHQDAGAEPPAQVELNYTPPMDEPLNYTPADLNYTPADMQISYDIPGRPEPDTKREQGADASLVFTQEFADTPLGTFPYTYFDLEFMARGSITAVVVEREGRPKQNLFGYANIGLKAEQWQANIPTTTDLLTTEMLGTLSMDDAYLRTYLELSNKRLLAAAATRFTFRSDKYPSVRVILEPWLLAGNYNPSKGTGYLGGFECDLAVIGDIRLPVGQDTDVLWSFKLTGFAFIKPNWPKIAATTAARLAGKTAAAAAETAAVATEAAGTGAGAAGGGAGAGTGALVGGEALATGAPSALATFGGIAGTIAVPLLVEAGLMFAFVQGDRRRDAITDAASDAAQLREWAMGAATDYAEVLSGVQPAPSTAAGKAAEAELVRLEGEFSCSRSKARELVRITRGTSYDIRAAAVRELLAHFQSVADAVEASGKAPDAAGTHGVSSTFFMPNPDADDSLLGADSRAAYYRYLKTLLKVEPDALVR